MSASKNSRRLSRLRIYANADNHTPATQEILWREWRNCDDTDYARHLFGLLVNQVPDGQVLVIWGLISAVLGVIGGLLVALSGWAGGVGMLSLPAGLIIGVGAAMATGLALRLRGRSCWSVWLGGLVPNKSIFSRAGGLNFAALYVALVFGLSSGIGVEVIGTLFFGQDNMQFYYLLTALALAAILGIARGGPANLASGAIGAIAGAIFGLLFGLGFAQVIGSLAGPLDVSSSARVAGMAVGFGFGWFWGRGAGFVGLLIIQATLTGLILVTSAGNSVLVGWLLGLLVGGVLGSYGLMWRPADRLFNFEGAYAYRRAFLWWASRPLAMQVEAALAAQTGQEGLFQQLRGQVVSYAMARSAVSRKAALPGQVRRRGWWPSVWRYLVFLIGSAPASPEEAQAADEPRQPAKTVEDLLKDLQAPTWQERFMARHALVALGGEAVPKLLDFANAGKSQGLGVWLIRSIGYETGRRLASEHHLWICPSCLTACGAHTAKFSYGQPITYHSCRTCGQSRYLLYCPQGVVAVLDAGWADMASYQDNQLRVNWLARQTLFDFDTVEIVHAGDEDVERLAMNAGNDTDPVRKARYPHVRCVVAPECRLSENSFRVLEQVFGQVESTATL